MLFNSFEFLFLFLPFVCFIYYWLSSRCRSNQNRYVAEIFLLCASLFFYGNWRPEYLLLIAASIGVNYTISESMRAYRKLARPLLYSGIVFNVGLLGYYKYTMFFLSSVNAAVGTTFNVPEIVLPLAISFFTFQQISYLVDSYTQRPDKRSLVEYALFVSFFPQLIAGPIVHHAEMMPQFREPSKKLVNWDNIYSGAGLLTIGLCKKVLIADGLSPYVHILFDKLVNPTFAESVLAATAYSLQLYFDFSGYTDMALGAALMLNIRLPQNFNSPYLASSIQEFWGRWHMTLSRWLREYVYIPLGGNRKGPSRTLLNLFLVFLIGGIWHGAGWTFILWGVLHGIAIVLHRIWKTAGFSLPRYAAHVVTILFVFSAWITFRATDINIALDMYKGLAGLNGLGFQEHFITLLSDSRLPLKDLFMLIGAGSVVVFTKWNSHWWRDHLTPSKVKTLTLAAIFFGVYFTMLKSTYVSEFIYFQF
ncbi:MAG: MBOAT family O-acyltransferase [Desulfovibrio sp.]